MLWPRKNRKSKAGFSLVELLTVVGIVTMLTLIVTEQVNLAKVRVARVERDTIVRGARASFTTYQFEFQDAIASALPGSPQSVWNWALGPKSAGDNCPPSTASMNAAVPAAGRSYFLFPISLQECLGLRSAINIYYFTSWIGGQHLFGLNAIALSGYSSNGTIRYGNPPVPHTACAGSNCRDYYFFPMLGNLTTGVYLDNIIDQMN